MEPFKLETPRECFICIILILAFTNAQASEEPKKDDPWYVEFAKDVLRQPLTVSYEQTMFTNEMSGISKLTFGLEGEKFEIIHGHEGEITRGEGQKFCQIGFGRKYYSHNSTDNLYFLDFNLYEWKAFPIMTIFYAGAHFNVLNKQTQIYSNDYIDWAKGGIALGFSIPYYKENTIIAYADLSFGYTSFTPDTINCPNLNQDYKKRNYRIFGLTTGGKVDFEGLSFDLTIKISDGIGSNTLRTMTGSTKLSYTLWKGDRNKHLKSGERNELEKTFQVYISYQENEVSVISNEDESDGNPNSPLYSHVIKAVNFGISYSFCKIID